VNTLLLLGLLARQQQRQWSMLVLLSHSLLSAICVSVSVCFSPVWLLTCKAPHTHLAWSNLQKLRPAICSIGLPFLLNAKTYLARMTCMFSSYSLLVPARLPIHCTLPACMHACLLHCRRSQGPRHRLLQGSRQQQRRQVQRSWQHV
jgi:hypothetical protein